MNLYLESEVEGKTWYDMEEQYPTPMDNKLYNFPRGENKQIPL